MKQKSIILFVCFLSIFLFTVGCGNKNNISEEADLNTTFNTLNTFNGSVSQYCEENGGKSEFIELADGNDLGTCFFVDGSFCDVWDYKSGICKPGDNPVAKNNVDTLSVEVKNSDNLG